MWHHQKNPRVCTYRSQGSEMIYSANKTEKSSNITASFRAAVSNPRPSRRFRAAQFRLPLWYMLPAYWQPVLILII